MAFDHAKLISRGRLKYRGPCATGSDGTVVYEIRLERAAETLGKPAYALPVWVLSGHDASECRRLDIPEDTPPGMYSRASGSLQRFEHAREVVAFVKSL